VALASPRIAEPGPGEWTVTDTDSRMDVSSGKLNFTAGTADWDRCTWLLTTPFGRRKAQYLEAQYTPTAATADHVISWNNSLTGNRSAWEAGVWFGGSGHVCAVDGARRGVNVRYPYTAGTSYVVRIYDGGPFGFSHTGGRGDFFIYIRPASTTLWTLLWRKRASSGWLTQVYAALNNKTAAGSMSWIRIRPGRLPTGSGGIGLPVANQRFVGCMDGIHEVQVVCPSSGVAGLTFRGTDDSNLWKLVMDKDNNRLDLIKREAGTDTTVGSIPETWVAEKIYTLSAVTFGDYIRCFLGRAEKSYTTSTFNNTAELSGNLDNAEYFNLRCDRGNTELQW
jgi:hypothetical protein